MIIQNWGIFSTDGELIAQSFQSEEEAIEWAHQMRLLPEQYTITLIEEWEE